MLGEIQWLSWKSRATREREAKEYSEWALPYGEAQREKITSILAEMLPKEDKKLVIVPYLTVKELVSKIAKDGVVSDASVLQLWKATKRYDRFIPKKDLPYHIALAVVDIAIDSELNYPPTAEIIENAKRYAALKKAADEAEK